MDPPPPPSAATATTAPDSTATESAETPTTTPPPSMLPPPQNPNTTADLPPPPLPPSDANNGGSNETKSEKNNNNNNVAVPYQIPAWSQPPSHPFLFEVLKDGSIVDHLDLTKKGAYMFGRIDLCDFVLEHPTISRFHAVIQFNGSGDAYLYDLGSTHGTFINKKQVKAKVYVDLHVGDVIRFGHSSRLYIFQGPEDLMLPEADLKGNSYAKDREASLRRAREGAALADGISWGIGEDAVEEAEDDPDELTWQTFKGELTEKQQKTREKVLKRMEKIAHMKKEISAIRAKDISQGGLTQGQQTQIARNEQRISQIFEELESLEETLNDSIRESLGARGKKSSRSRKKGLMEDEDEMSSDDDEFYDRTKKKPVSKSADAEVVETADSLLDKKEALVKEMEEKKRVLSEEKNKISEPVAEQNAGDVLDAFMSGLSSQLVVDRTVQLEKDISTLQTELDRIVYLLKIADPTEETAKKRAIMVKEQTCKDNPSSRPAVKRPEKSKIVKNNVSQPEPSSGANQVAPVVAEKTSLVPTSGNDVTDSAENKPSTYTAVKPQWLGAVEERELKKSELVKSVDSNEGDEFVDYKDRQKILESNDSQVGTKPESEIENAAPGLILRKRKTVETAENQMSESSAASSADTMVEDAVALLLKHKRGLYAADEEAVLENDHERDEKQPGQENKRAKRVLGPEKPAFLKTKDDATWVPPKGQSGDGRTSLNDRLGY
ncbi:hypothetical protein RND81_10G115400 [Saponaria officinalis]|uniref:FHA domain-containing protein n=1 Tax=Saponaria officinalis TaxID=3572 RepID=A0AAW1I3D7_SAPOF